MMRAVILVWLIACAVSLEARRHHKHGRAEVQEARRDDYSTAGAAGAAGAKAALKDGEGVGRGPPIKHRGHARKHHPVDFSTDTVYKDEWKRITDYHKTDPAACQPLRCRRRQVCLINAQTNQAECVYKRVLRQRRKMKRGEAKADQKAAGSKEEKRRQAHVENARHKNTHTPSGRGRLSSGLFKQQSKVSFDYVDRSASKKATVGHGRQNSVLTEKPKKECTQRDLSEMGRRLLDWFKLLQEEDERERRSRNAHHKTKRNSKKRELRDDDECVCHAPVSWEFDQLDVDLDGQLSALELQDIEDNGYEHCVRPFINVCDHDHDMELSQKEWCCCFADVLPPCLGTQHKVTKEIEGRSRVMIGAYVPECDSDGFYKTQQCHGSTGQCWCVDRNGHEIADTRRTGAADCEKYTKRLTGEDEV